MGQLHFYEIQNYENLKLPKRKVMQRLIAILIDNFNRHWDDWSEGQGQIKCILSDTLITTFSQFIENLPSYKIKKHIQKYISM